MCQSSQRRDIMVCLTIIRGSQLSIEGLPIQTEAVLMREGPSLSPGLIFNQCGSSNTTVNCLCGSSWKSNSKSGRSSSSSGSIISSSSNSSNL